MKNSRDTRPHIVIATTAFAPFLGGAEIAVQELIKKMSTSFRFTIVTARMDSKLARRDVWEGFDVIRVGCGSKFDKLWLIAIFPWYAWRLKRQHGAILVWAIMASYAGIGAMLADSLGILPYVLTLQEGDDLEGIEKRVRIVPRIFKHIFLRARGIQVIAPFLADWAKKQGARALPVVIPNGVSSELFSMTSDERAQYRVETRTDLGIPDDARVVLSVSRLVEKNGLGDLVAAIHNLPDVHLLIVGDGELRGELEERAKASALRIHFIGSQQQTVLKKYYAAADVFCRPAHSEGQGIVFLEALQAGLPVVATRVGGIPSIIEDGVHGVLVEPRNVEVLTAAIDGVLKNPEGCAQMVARGKVHVAKFNWDIIAPRIKEWLNNAISLT